MLGLVGEIAMEVMQPGATVKLVDPAMAGFCREVAVICPEPTALAVISPEVVMLAALEAELSSVQVTPVLPVLPSLKVATADICTVLLVTPVWIVGVGGVRAREVTVGLTKNPRQLIANARVASTARAPASRSSCFVDNIVVEAPKGRARSEIQFCRRYWPTTGNYERPAKIVAETIWPGSHASTWKPKRRTIAANRPRAVPFPGRTPVVA